MHIDTKLIDVFHLDTYSRPRSCSKQGIELFGCQSKTVLATGIGAVYRGVIAIRILKGDKGSWFLNSTDHENMKPGGWGVCLGVRGCFGRGHFIYWSVYNIMHIELYLKDVAGYLDKLRSMHMFFNYRSLKHNHIFMVI